MSTYKAEFLSHYYERHWRSRSAYAFGLISTWATFAARAPRLVNWVTHAAGLQRLAKWAGGMPAQREIPAFARVTFRRWFSKHRRRPALTSGSITSTSTHDVLLWTDTFTNYFHPNTAIAAVEVLEDAGYAVHITREQMCCGRPHYDYGMLGLAKQRLEHILRALGDDERTPIVVLEPSCAAVFRDELRNLFAGDARAERVARRVHSLGEFLASAGWTPSNRLQRHALLHGHCHQKALSGLPGEIEVLQRLGVECEVLDAGCCGMAGSFGFERDHFAVSQAVGERRLLPRVRAADPGTLIIADGFSCREQVHQLTGRPALHLADVIGLALHASTQADQPTSRGG
jgi:Fe-S oxidoreductase